MRFQILSHAGLRVSSGDTHLVIDPWLVGSCYWRSWWNYPPVPDDVIADTRADAIYLTHVHWDHFQGPSLRRFATTTPVYVPRGHYSRMKRDLAQVGFHDVRELRHGESATVGPIKLTSWQFFPFLDSAVVVEADGTTLFDANDAKFMGGPLRQILDRHPSIDFVFRSHSSANGRLCFDVVDDPTTPVDDNESYLRSFAAFVQATGARWAIPFASNHCLLHDEVFHLNDGVQTPDKVAAWFEDHHIASPTVKVMVSGDVWDEREGFQIRPDSADWFTDRPARLAAWRIQVADRLADQDRKEARATVSLALVQRWTTAFSAKLPRAVRWLYRHHPVVFVLHAGERSFVYEANLHTGQARELPEVPTDRPPFEVHTAAFIFRQCVTLDLFSHLPISKRARFRVTRANKRWMTLLHLLWEAADYDWLPLGGIDRQRAGEVLVDRWREGVLYARIAADLAAGRGFDQVRYLQGFGRRPA